MSEAKTADAASSAAAAGKKAKEAEPRVKFGELFRYADGVDKFLYFVGGIAAVGNGLTMPLFSLIFGELLDSFNPAEESDSIMDEVKKNSLYISLAGVGAFLLSYLEIACFTIAGERQARVIRDRYFSSLLNQDIAWFDQQTTESIVTKVADETRTIKEGISDKLGLGMRFFCTFLGGFVMAFIEGWQLTLLLCVMAPLMAIAGGFMMKLMADLEGRAAKLYAAAGAIAQERLAAVRTVQAFGGQEEAQEKYDELLDGTLSAGIKKGFVSGGSMAFTMVVMFCTYGLAFWFGSVLIADDREDLLSDLGALGCPNTPDFDVTCTQFYLDNQAAACKTFCEDVVFPCLLGDTCHSGGNVVLVFFAVIIGAMAIGQATPSATSAAQAQVAAYQVFKVVDRVVPISVASDEGKKVSKDSVHGRIVLRDVHFSYPSRPDRKVLDGLNLTIEPGTTVALVGRSGCGKSTVVSLIQRFYDPDQGTVELDDHGPLTDINVRCLRSSMGLVGQEPILFATTIKENIKFGVDGEHAATDAQVEGAARMANAHDFIMDFQHNYDTVVGARGGSLSGGQKQRVAIARAIIRKPKILLLDEATSALDSTSEVVVQEALNGIMASRDHTTVVIAHRLSTIKEADKIVVLEQGKVVEEGSHAELMDIHDGVYRDLVEAQLSGRDGALTDISGVTEAELKKEEVVAGAGSGAGAGAGKASSTDVDVLIEDGRTRSRSRSRSRSRTASIFTVAPEADPDVDTSVMRIFRLTKPQCGWVAISFLAAMVNGSIFPLFSIAFSEMITIFFEPEIDVMRDDGVFWGVGFVILGVLAGLSNLGMFGGFGVVGQNLSRRLRSMAFRAMLHKDMAFHDQEDNSTGVLATQLATDATLVNSMASERGALAAQNIVTAVAGLTIAFSNDWRLSLVVLACAPVIAVAGKLQMQVFTGQSAGVAKSLEKAGHVVEESVHGIRTVAAFNLSHEMGDRYRARLVEPQEKGIKSGHTSGIGFGFSQFAMFATYGLAFYVGGLWVEDGTLTFNDMLTVLMTIMMTAMALGQSNSLAPDAAKAQTAVKNIFTTLDKQPVIDRDSDSQTTLERVDGHVEFKHVDFKYPTRDGMILTNFSLDIPAGSSVALVGTSGSGKSTLVQLLQRFYDPVNPEGAVKLDGHNLKQLQVGWLRRNIGVVSQEPTLFNGSIAFNIAYGLVAFHKKMEGDLVSVDLFSGDDAGESARNERAAKTSAPTGTQRVNAQIVEAAKAANAHDFIVRMADGYHTVIKPDSLSGGQKQRIAIARAILRDPPILLLDEATSALDNRSEHVVQEALDRLLAAKRRTTIVVAHRLSTIYKSDNIVVMERGSIIEQGTHDFLLSDDAPAGKYRTMWNQQSLVGGGGNGKAAATTPTVE